MSKIDDLASLLKEILNDGTEVNTSEFPFIKIVGDVDGKGILWVGKGYNKQFLFLSNPDRFFVSETLDIAKDKAFSVNGINVLSGTELGPTVTKSNLREVGHLKGLVVDGGLSVNQYLVYDANTDRLGIGTQDPKAILDLVDQNTEILIGSSKPNVAFIRTFNSSDLELGTDDTTRFAIEAGGNITLGNSGYGDTKVKVIGKLCVNVNNPDARVALDVNGSIKFNNTLHLKDTDAPTSGSFNQGDIVWNSQPQPGRFVGWVCLQSGTPGLWSGFGRIE